MAVIAIGRSKWRSPSRTYSPMKMHACSAVAPKNTTKRGRAWLTMNCVPATPVTNPATLLASPSIPRMPPDNASWASPAERAAQQAGHPARGEGGVDHHHEHQVDRHRPADHEAGDRRLQQHGPDDARHHPEPLHGVPGGVAGDAGVPNTTSTASMLEKSTAGRTITTRLRAGALDALDGAHHEPLRVDPIDAGRDDRVSGIHQGGRRQVLEPQRPVRAGHDDALRARLLHGRRRSGIGIDEQLHDRCTGARLDDAPDDAGGCHDGHVDRHAGLFALVDGEGPEVRDRAAGHHLGRDGLERQPHAQIEQRAQRLGRPRQRPLLLQAHAEVRDLAGERRFSARTSRRAM